MCHMNVFIAYVYRSCYVVAIFSRKATVMLVIKTAFAYINQSLL